MSEITEEKYRQLKRAVEDARAAAERSKGALEQLMAQLKKDFGCSTLKEAKFLLADLETKKARATEKFTKALKDYERKWGKE